jgi:hypothetical protein
VRVTETTDPRATPAGLYFVRSSQVKEKPVAGDVALYVEAHRSIHVPNATARFIWEALRHPLTFDELLFVVSEAFSGTDSAILRRDLEETLERFVALGLLTREARDDGGPVS